MGHVGCWFKSPLAVKGQQAAVRAEGVPGGVKVGVVGGVWGGVGEAWEEGPEG